MSPSQNSDCEHDKKDCDDIHSWECYEESTLHDCCHTCQEYTSSPVIEGCEFGDRDAECNVQGGIQCYTTSVRQRCCATCQSYHTDNPGCNYGDKIEKCESSKCHTYSSKRLRDCCATCDGINLTSSATSSGTTSDWFTITHTGSQSTNDTTVNPSGSSQNGLPTWAIPAAAGVGGLIVILLIIIIIVMVRRSRRKHDILSPIDEKMYNEYKLSKRAPVPPPRPLSTHHDRVIERKDSAEYAYINPDDVGKPSDSTRRSGFDPLPPTPSAPAEYLDLNADNKYSDVKALEAPGGDKIQDTDQRVKRHNSYQLFPTSNTGTVDRNNEYLQPQSNPNNSTPGQFTNAGYGSTPPEYQPERF